MKLSKLIFFVASLIFVSCSNDDAGNGSSNFSIPLGIGNYWTYDVESMGTLSRDSLYISGNVTIDGKMYKQFETKDDIATGFYSNSLRNNRVRLLDGKILLSGDLSLAGLEDLGLNFNLTLDDFVIFSRNATSGQLLSTKSEIIQENFDGIPVTISYSLKSFGGQTLNTFNSPNGDFYENVKSVVVRLNVTVTTVQEIFGFPIVITVLAPQDVIVSTQYIASGIGVIYTNTDTSYTLNSTIADQFGIPASGSQNQQEFLDTYFID